ncbi:hypothetical protein P170DRAFT_438110 [Aspergillus steynii IBT 23096]|uniref:MARVEL domain-containing protein n=1 Tax=Aspergillus steynii IBT 23096 TaxID=1392250 RepID=A0A2I2G6M8_9EURO|nr:uncharacterized protein P170DRAFT_438110 [Aspergillus steynii IBT 23096]PLB48526.1 hypothetical protein P170DRAFT_438110 [Aspergillus steynii IBT 23096]
MADISENTPLLRDSSDSGAAEHERHDIPTQNPADNSLRFVTALTWSSLVLAVLVVAFDLTVNILEETNYGSGYYMPWVMRIAITAMCVVGLATVLISFLNLVRLYHSQRALWLWLNLIFDFIIALYSIVYCGQGIVLNWAETCDPSSENCRFTRRIEAFAYITLGFGLALGITHLVLFFLRCALAFRMRFWRGFQHWRLPAGQLTVEFTIKFLRQEPQSGEAQNQ